MVAPTSALAASVPSLSHALVLSICSSVSHRIPNCFGLGGTQIPASAAPAVAGTLLLSQAAPSPGAQPGLGHPGAGQCFRAVTGLCSLVCPAPCSAGPSVPPPHHHAAGVTHLERFSAQNPGKCLECSVCSALPCAGVLLKQSIPGVARVENAGDGAPLSWRGGGGAGLPQACPTRDEAVLAVWVPAGLSVLQCRCCPQSCSPRMVRVGNGDRE